MLTKEQIIENVQALFRLADGNPSQGEAEAAMAKAAKLMAEHNIASIDLQEPSQFTDQTINKSPKRSWDTDAVAAILNQFFFVRVSYFTKQTGWNHGRRVSEFHLRIFGTKENVDVANHVYVYLSRTFRNLWEQARREHGFKRTDAKTYYHGLQIGFSMKMEELRKPVINQNPNALMVVNSQLIEAQKKFIQDQIDNNGVTRKNLTLARLQGSDAAYEKGIQDGREINLNPAIDQNQCQRLAPANQRIAV